MKTFLLAILLTIITITGFSTTITVVDAGFTFSPDTIYITYGDTVLFDLSSSHNATEVSQSTWNSGGNTHLSGGFQTSYGGGLVYPSSLTVGTHYYVCTPHASMGMKGIIFVQSCTPATPGNISGSTSICASSSNTYSISAVSGATSYTWTLPSGWSGSSTSTSITASAGSSGGNITVKANNSCGSSAARTLSVTVNSIPNTPGSISGNTSVCSSSTNNYSIGVISGATSYTWTLPSGWSGSSTTNSISVTSGSSGGNITVSANNSCGSSATQSLAVTVNSNPSTPGTINGNTTVCAGSSNTYSIAAVNGATSYTWSLPTGWTGSSATNSITATAGTSAGNITVIANNGCGSSAVSTLAISVNTIPITPGIINGDTNICLSTTSTYLINPVNGATSYTWTIPQGWSGNSTTNSITVTAGKSSGNITVTANNGCGSSSAQTLSVLADTSVPVISGVIIGDTLVCDSSLNTYNLSPVSGATSYNWTLPANWTGLSNTNTISVIAINTSGNITVSANNSCGTSASKSISITISGGSALPKPGPISGNSNICEGTTNTYSITPVNGATSYNWILPNGWTGSSSTNSISVTANGTSGDIKVSAKNFCGLSALQSLSVNVTTVPVKPDSIYGDTIVCNSVSSTFSTSDVKGATSYTWTLPGGWTGNSATNILNAVAGISGGIITVTANNSCGSSASASKSVSVNSAPDSAGSINGNSTVCSLSSNTYSIPVISRATSYTWTLPSGWTGNSATNSISAVAGITGGNITVKANNSCGTSAETTLGIKVITLPEKPGIISGDTSVCSMSSITYSIKDVNGATSYTWSLPNSWSGNSTSNIINATAGTAGGNITVVSKNTCGSSSEQILGVKTKTVNTSVLQSGKTLTAIDTEAAYQWINCSDNSPIAGQNSHMFQASANGSYAVIVTKNGCSGTSQCFEINNTGVSENDNQPVLEIHPNPSNGKFQITLSNTTQSGYSKIEIYNLQGKIVYQSNHLNSDIDLSDEPEGVYLVRLNFGTSVLTKRIIIQ